MEPMTLAVAGVAALAILLIAVAASSSFQTSRDVRLRPGETAQVGDYSVTYVRPTAYIDPGEQRLNFGSVLAVQRDGKPLTTLTPSRNYYSSSSSGATSTKTWCQLKLIIPFHSENCLAAA